MATLGEKLAKVETRVDGLERNQSEMWDHINDKLPKKMDEKVSAQSNATLIKFIGIVGSLLIIQTVVEKIAG